MAGMLQLPAGDITRDFMAKLVETVNELTLAREKIASLETELGEAKEEIRKSTSVVAQQVGRRDPLENKWHEFCFPPVALVQITEAGTGGDAGKYKVKEVTYDSNIKADYAGGRVLSSFTNAYAKEVNGRTDIPVGDVVPMFAYETPSGFNYVIGPFFSSGGGGGLTVRVFRCNSGEYVNPGCSLDAIPLSYAASTLDFKSGCQVGDLRWTSTFADSAIRGVVWTLGVKAVASAWTHAPVGTYTSAPVVTLEIDNSGNTGTGGTPADIEFRLTESNEATRSTNGEWCGGKVVTMYGIIKGGNGIITTWDDGGTENESQSPTKRVYFKTGINSGTLPNKKQAVKWTITKDNATKKITVQPYAQIAMGDIANVDDSTAAVDIETRHSHVLAWDNEAGYYVRLKKNNVDVVTNVLWDDSAGELKQTKRRLTFFGKAGNEDTTVVDTAVACTTT